MWKPQLGSRQVQARYIKARLFLALVAPHIELSQAGLLYHFKDFLIRWQEMKVAAEKGRGFHINIKRKYKYSGDWRVLLGKTLIGLLIG